MTHPKSAIDTPRSWTTFFSFSLVAVLVVWIPAGAGTVKYDYDAVEDTAGDSTWENELTSTSPVKDLTFDTSASPIDVTGSSTTLTKAYDFGGSLTTAYTTSFGTDSALGTAAAFEMWVKPDDLSGKEVLFETGGCTHGLSLLLDDTSLEFRTRTNDTTQRDVTTTLSSGQISDFLQVVGVVDTAGSQTRLYVNGLRVGTTSGTADWTKGTSEAAIANFHDPTISTHLGAVDDNTSWNGFDGQVARARFYDGAQSDNKVYLTYADIARTGTDDYSQSVLADGPVAYWRLGEQAGATTAFNRGSTGGAVDGTHSASGVTNNQPGLVGTGNTAASFDGSSGYIAIPSHDDINTRSGGYTNKSIGLWFNADTVPGAADYSVLYEQGGISNGLNVFLHDGKLYAGIYQSSPANAGDWVSTPVTAGTTHNVAMTWDGSTGVKDLVMYLDGALVGMDESTISPPLIGTDDIGIGAVNVGTRYSTSLSKAGGPFDFFDGTIDDLSLYNTTLTPKQVQTQYVIGSGDWLGLTNGDETGTGCDVTLGVTLNYDAKNAASDTLWSESVGTVPKVGPANGFQWDLTGATLKTDAGGDVSDHAGITAAYEFSGSGSGAVHPGDYSGNPPSWDHLLPGDLTDKSATVEIWFKPDDLTGKEVLWETGGASIGSSFRLNGDLLELVNIQGGTNQKLLTVDLDKGNDGIDYGDFIQAVAVIDFDGDFLRLYVNGTHEVSISGYTNSDWSGSGSTALGWEKFELGGGDNGLYGNYDGQIAILRYYNWALNSGEILANYTAVAVPEPSSLAMLLGAAGWCLIWHRRKHRRAA